MAKKRKRALKPVFDPYKLQVLIEKYGKNKSEISKILGLWPEAVGRWARPITDHRFAEPQLRHFFMMMRLFEVNYTGLLTDEFLEVIFDESRFHFVQTCEWGEMVSGTPLYSGPCTKPTKANFRSKKKTYSLCDLHHSVTKNLVKK